VLACRRAHVRHTTCTPVLCPPSEWERFPPASHVSTAVAHDAMRSCRAATWEAHACETTSVSAVETLLQSLEYGWSRCGGGATYLGEREISEWDGTQKYCDRKCEWDHERRLETVYARVSWGCILTVSMSVDPSRDPAYFARDISHLCKRQHVVWTRHACPRMSNDSRQHEQGTLVRSACLSHECHCCVVCSDELHSVVSFYTESYLVRDEEQSQCRNAISSPISSWPTWSRTEAISEHEFSRMTGATATLQKRSAISAQHSRTNQSQRMASIRKSHKANAASPFTHSKRCEPINITALLL